MLEVVFILLIIGLAIVAFNIQNSILIRSKRNELRKEVAEKSIRQNPEKRTIDLIGEKAYDEMTDRIDIILRKHSHQQCITVNLSCGPDTKEGSNQLHKILPGTSVVLNTCYEGGVNWIDVYNNGARIGRLTLLEAVAVNEVMKANLITGAYVAEQNCYGIENSYQLAIILFYEPKNEENTDITKVFSYGYPFPKSFSEGLNICEN